MLALMLIAAAVISIITQPVASQMTTEVQNQPSNASGGSFAGASSTASLTATGPQLIHYLQRPADFDYRTGSFTLGEYEEISHPIPFPFEAETEHICLYYDYFVFNAGASQRISLHFETTSPVRFYVMNLDQLYSFYHSFCGHEYWSFDAKTFGTSYRLDWVVPKTGAYVFLFMTDRPYGAYDNIEFTAQIA